MVVGARTDPTPSLRALPRDVGHGPRAGLGGRMRESEELAPRNRPRHPRARSAASAAGAAPAVAFYVGVLRAWPWPPRAPRRCLVNIFERKSEATNPFVRVVDVGEDDTDPAKWGELAQASTTLQAHGAAHATRFGGHGGSEALPDEKIERDPWLKRMFLGYAFSIDYRDRRGHAYMLADQEATERLTKPQSGSCLHCHASVMPLYRKLGNGDAMRGFEPDLQDDLPGANEQAAARCGHAHPVSCVDCHDPEDHGAAGDPPRLHQGHPGLAASDGAGAPPAVDRGVAQGQARAALRPQHRRDAQRDALLRLRSVPRRVLLLDQDAADVPVGQGPEGGGDRGVLDETKFPDGGAFFDYKHAETGAPILKAQHPEFELWSQGIHARSGVSCADCHMPYMRDGASKVSDHWVRSPLLNINRACQTCHRASEGRWRPASMSSRSATTS
jgi:nitrite reductase (cytochrome c-552)